MSLHDDLQNYIHELQALLQETHEQALIDKARDLWGQDDARYEVLEQFVASSGDRFAKPANPPAREQRVKKMCNIASIGSIDFFEKPAEPPAPESGHTSENKSVK
jgi:hypothetical protein